MSIIDYLYDQGGGGADFMLTGENMPKGWGDDHYSEENLYTDNEVPIEEKGEPDLDEIEDDTRFKYYSESPVDTRDGWLKRDRLVKANEEAVHQLEELSFYNEVQTIDIYNYVSDMCNSIDELLEPIISILSQEENSNNDKLLEEIKTTTKSLEMKILSRL